MTALPSVSTDVTVMHRWFVASSSKAMDDGRASNAGRCRAHEPEYGGLRRSRQLSSSPALLRLRPSCSWRHTSPSTLQGRLPARDWVAEAASACRPEIALTFVKRCWQSRPQARRRPRCRRNRTPDEGASRAIFEECDSSFPSHELNIWIRQCATEFALRRLSAESRPDQDGCAPWLGAGGDGEIPCVLPGSPMSLSAAKTYWLFGTSAMKSSTSRLTPHSCASCRSELALPVTTAETSDLSG